MTQLLRTTGIRRVFTSSHEPRVALDGVEFCVDCGEFVCLVGPSGSGKSTLLSIVAGLDRSFEGQVFVWGRDLKTMNDRELTSFRATKLGFVFQGFHLLEHLRVIDNVMLPFVFSHVPNAHDLAMKALELVALQDRALDMTTGLSGGQRQRVAIARAIVHRPSLLLCDEPTGNLDTATAAQIIDVFRELHREHSTTIVCATHDENIRRVATRTVHINEGKITLGSSVDGSDAIIAADSGNETKSLDCAIAREPNDETP